jgi:DegV family protein with EDD domain
MIHIVTDSTCEAPKEVMNHPAVHVVPLSVVFGQTALSDELDITREEFWKRLPTADPPPSTSQANPGDFEDLFRRYSEGGHEVISILLSSKLSGTYSSAIVAKESLPGRPIDIVDSLSISVGLGIMVAKALEMVEAGKTRQQIVDHMMQMRDNVHILFALDTLEYIQRGGRIGKATVLVGTLLRFKPLLEIKDGEVTAAGRVRTRRKALETMIELLSQLVPQRGPAVKLGVAEGEAKQDAVMVAQSMKECFQTPHIIMSTLGPVIGTHVGPGVIGAAAYYDGEV